MNAELSIIAELVQRESGIQIKQPQLPSLAAALNRISPAVSARSFIEAIGDAAYAPTLLGALIDEVAVQETYFMRERDELEAIDWATLLARANARGDREVRVWVCACASGEEAYSLAMLAIESLEHEGIEHESIGREGIPISIFASDVSQRALSRAATGIYSERSTREIEDWRRDRFFIDRGHRSAVGKELRALVRLGRHNLVRDPIPPLGEMQFDLILCRNVLIYFDPTHAEMVVRSLESALQPGGQLILGASDRLSSLARCLGDGPVRAQRRSTAAASSASRRARPAASSSRRGPATVVDAAGMVEAATGDAAAMPTVTGDRATTATQQQMRDAHSAGNVGNYCEAIGITTEIIAAHPLDAEAYFVRGLSELAAGDPVSATESLRRALYIDPTFAVAAFQLGRAYDLRGEPRAAARAYRQALSMLDSGGEAGHAHLPEQVHASDIAAACRARLRQVG